MAFPLLYSLSFLLLLLQPFLSFAQTRGNITIGASLSASQNSSSWLSPNGDFAFGFRSLDSNKDLFLLSIWYAKIPQKTIVWFSNGDSPAASGTKVELTVDRGLVLTSPQGRELWKSDPIIGTVGYGLMNDTGNFVLLSDNTNKLWESFNNPTDTMLPSQIFENGQFLSSKQSDGNFSKGRFRFELNSDGNLVLTTVNLPSDYTNEPYYESKTNGSSNQLVFNQSGYMYILQENDRRFALTRRVETSASNFYYRATINFDGVFTQYQHPKNSTGNEGWTAVWSLPDDICKASFVSTGSGICGFNSVCSLNADRRPICECPRGYTLIDPNDQYGNCKPNYTQSCVDDDEPGSPEDLYDFEVITNTDWPTSDYQLLTPFTEEGCRQSCLHDCMCAVAIFRSGDMCWKKKLPLSNGRFDANLNGKALIKIRKAAQSNGTISIGQQLTAAEKTEPWLSPSKDFAFGFHHLDSKDLFLPAIWYYKIPSKTIVWYASEDNPAPRGSKLKLTADRGLVLEDPKGREIWKSEISTGQAAFGVLYDTGNFLIANTNSKKLWQSFDHPTDTLLPTQKMERGWVVSSRRKEKDFSRGRFQFRLLGDGNAVLNTINLESGFGYDAYFWSNTFDVNRSNAGYRVVFNESGQLYVLRENNQIVSLTPETVSAKENYLRATLSFDGVFIFYSHPKNNSTGDAIWSVSDVLPENICINNDIRKGLGSGICGFNSICSISGTKRPICQCPKGFSLLDPDDVYGSCKPDFIQGCEEDGKKSGEDLYYIEELRNTDWPTSDYEQISPYSKDECVSSCLKDCQCSAAVLRDDTCWKKKLPLSYGKTDRDETGTTFIKIRKVPSGGKKKVDVLIPVVSVLFGSSALINLLLVSACCLGFLVVNRNQFIRPHQEDQGVSYMNLRCFTYKELVEITCGFKEEIGRGAFGTVYKGFANMGSSNHVAVKRLNRVFQDSEKEFKAEVNGIGQTHHKNLVRLLGYSDEGQNRLLVYEFMSNGTLASFLFGDSKPNWKLRTEIAMGIARGLLYLHEDCCTQIIHCDIKPQNILLDDYYNARISDFGLAKLLTLDQSHTSTAIRGTKGYVAPEWFRNMPITVKVDVYSYGVLLLEIICLRRSIDNEISKVDKAILTDWAYDCYQERTLGALVENDLEAMDDMIVLQRFVMVAIWCIQEDPAHRPTMRRVTQMLEGVVEVPIPPCHGP